MGRLLLDMPAYDDDIWTLHQQTVSALRDAPAYEFRYHALAPAVHFLASLLDKTHAHEDRRIAAPNCRGSGV